MKISIIDTDPQTYINKKKEREEKSLVKSKERYERAVAAALYVPSRLKQFLMKLPHITFQHDRYGWKDVSLSTAVWKDLGRVLPTPPDGSKYGKITYYAWHYTHTRLFSIRLPRFYR